MTKTTGTDDVRATVQRIILSQLDANPEKITDASRLIDDLNADSFDMIELTIAIEDELDVEITDAEIEELKTVGDVVALAEKKSAVPA